MQLLKLGGSVITDKSKPFTARTENIDRLSKEIASTGSELNVLVHGGGSYGHTVAEEHQIADGFRTKEQLLGFSHTHQAMLTLNHLIVDRLLKAGVNAFSLSPSSFILTKDRKMDKIDYRLLESYIKLGMLPVLYGDAVLDHSKGFTILSGDQLIVDIAKHLEADRIIMGCDVDGIFTSDPKKGGNARLIESLRVSDIEVAELGKALDTDVTGGMMGKVMEASEAVKAGIEVIFINACVKGRVRSALLGENVKGTILKR